MHIWLRTGNGHLKGISGDFFFWRRNPSPPSEKHCSSVIDGHPGREYLENWARTAWWDTCVREAEESEEPSEKLHAAKLRE